MSKLNMLLICGEQDNIVNHDCSTAMLQHVSAPDVTVVDVPGGHMGILEEQGSGNLSGRSLLIGWLSDQR